MPQLDVSTFPSQIFWLVICFAVLCFAMVAFLVPRMAQIMASRAMTLEELRQKADQLAMEANQLSRQNEEHLQAAKVEIHSKINQSMAELAKAKDDKIHEFEAQLHRQINDVQQKLNQHKEEILNSSQQIISHLLEDMYRRLTQQELDAEHLATVKNSQDKGL